jgi:anti-sigma regulatory factor (Ser/Thr protein kinase)
MECVLSQGYAQSVHSVVEPSQIAAARRAAGDLSRRLGFNEVQAGRLALVITEAGTNLIKHAVEGMIILRPVDHGEMSCIEVLAIDRGPGIANLSASFHDGVTTANSPGTGLGAMQRLSDEFDAYTEVGKGSVFFMVVMAMTKPPLNRRLKIGAVCLPIASEDLNGDTWNIAGTGASLTVMVGDGLGHGPDAHAASRKAMDVLDKTPTMDPVGLLELSHAALAGTRGAALAIVRLDFHRHTMQFVGIGNIAACVQSADIRRHMMSHNGIVGNNMRKVQQFDSDFADNALLIMHSDGISTQWDLNRYGGLINHHPAVIAAVLYRDFRRERDDVTVLVIKHS